MSGWLRRRRPVVLPLPPIGQARPGGRMVQRRAADAPIQLGHAARTRLDIYHRILVLSWDRFLLLFSATYLLLNVAFAGLFLLQPGSIDHARPGSFADAFSFSVQTLSTVGYGTLTPASGYANALVTAESMVGLILVAFTTGLTFARFSRPTARVDFSRVATVGPYNGVPTLTVRLANSRRNQILEADVGMTLIRNELSLEGHRMRRFYDLRLSRHHTPVFSLTFSVMHPIDEESPFHGATLESLAAQDAEILVTVTGLDETMSQTIHARTSYVAGEIMFGQRFLDMFGYTPEGRIVIDFANFHAVEPVTPA